MEEVTEESLELAMRAAEKGCELGATDACGLRSEIRQLQQDL